MTRRILPVIFLKAGLAILLTCQLQSVFYSPISTRLEITPAFVSEHLPTARQEFTEPENRSHNIHGEAGDWEKMVLGDPESSPTPKPRFQQPLNHPRSAEGQLKSTDGTSLSCWNVAKMISISFAYPFAFSKEKNNLLRTQSPNIYFCLVRLFCWVNRRCPLPRLLVGLNSSLCKDLDLLSQVIAKTWYIFFG